MGSFEPLINGLVLLTVLSVVSARLTNLVKLRRPELREKGNPKDGKAKDGSLNERVREYRICVHCILVGIVVAIVVKADFFEILNNLESPWKTLGWVNVDNYRWTKSPAKVGFGTALYAIAGCVVTGFGLGFGSKFWHDVLGSVYELRDLARVRKQRPTKS